VRYFFRKLLKQFFIIFTLTLFLTGFGNYVFAESYEDPAVILETNLGEIVITFFPYDAPNHVENFIKLSSEEFYDETLFHRIIPGFMIQGGDPNTINGDPNTWGQGGPDTNVTEEFNSIKHNRGIVSMARSADPNSAGSQFFIVHKDSTFLDGEYTVFGRIATQESFETLDKIANVKTDSRDKPEEPEQVRIINTLVIEESKISNLLELTDPERVHVPIISRQTGNQIFESQELDVKFSAPEGWLLQQPTKTSPDSPDIAVVGPKINGVNPVISLTIMDAGEKTLDELISEKNNNLAEAVYSKQLEIISQKKIKSNVYQTEAVGTFSPREIEYKIKFVEVMIFSESMLYTFAYSNLLENFENELPKFNESLNSFEIPSEHSRLNFSEKSTEEEIGGCLIATATYGSEMASQVQQLRELRDNQLLNTEFGSAFMSGFNELYYTFSPTIADYERENPYFKEAVKIAITPMISTLSLMENAESESEVLSIGISVIVLNLGMYLGIPAIVVIGIKRKI
jgi:peptidyl-prolyl cis-trans isomerase B (cyclophilin B)